MSGVVVYKMALSNDCVWLVRQGFPEKVQCRPPAPTQRSEVLGMSMMPSTGLPWCSRASSESQSGETEMKLRVPYMGSMDQTNSATSKAERRVGKEWVETVGIRG